MRDENHTELMHWIAEKNISCTEKLLTIYSELTEFQQGNLQGYMEALEDFRLKILMVYNPHNREDIRKANEMPDCNY